MHHFLSRATSAVLLFGAFSVLTTYAHAELPQDSRRAGGIAIIEVTMDTKTASFGERPVALVIEGNKKYAIVGLPITITTGIHLLDTDSNHYDFAVADHAYPEQRLTITDQSKVSPDSEQLARYQREAVEQATVYKKFSPVQVTHFPKFIWPARGIISSPFGFKRFFNDEPRAPHAGLDIAAGLGTVARAPANGVVVQTGDYFFNGQTVMIDHGQGIVTMLCHLNRIDVGIGQTVRQGEAVGLIGKTGRATGPHLHFGVSLNNARIDPLLILPKDQNEGQVTTGNIP